MIPFCFFFPDLTILLIFGILCYQINEVGCSFGYGCCAGQKMVGERLRRGWAYERVEDYKERKMFEVAPAAYASACSPVLLQ